MIRRVGASNDSMAGTIVPFIFYPVRFVDQARFATQNKKCLAKSGDIESFAEGRGQVSNLFVSDLGKIMQLI